MSAICGLYRFGDRPVEARSIDRMLAAMERWGSGPSRSWVDGEARAALGCRLMPVTPEDEFDAQPAVSGDGTVVLAADARIDNRPELAAELAIPRDETAELPDSAFILAAWSAWGVECASRLVGDFAFALWDERRRALFCARDPLGQRVLFQHRSPDRLAVSSSMHALLTLPDVPARLDEQKIAELLVLLENAESTCFTGITRLPPGHTLLATPDGVRQDRYWTPDSGRRIHLGSDEEYLEAFGEVFRRSVRDRLRSTGPVAIMVSGGLDSSSVAAVAADILRESDGRLSAYHSAPSAGFEGTARTGWVNDESAEVRELASLHENMDLEVLRGHAGTPLSDAENSFEVLGAPVRNSINLSWVRQIYEEAVRQGARVMLNGGKGNLTLSYTGLRSIPDMAKRGRIARATREARAVARVRNQRATDVIRDQVLRPLVPVGVLAVYGKLRNGQRRASPIWEASMSAIRPDVARRLRLEELARDRRSDEASLSRAPAAEYRYRVLALGGDGFDVAHSLRGWFPVETREAPTDMRLVEFCLALPGSQYLRDGHDRQLVRRAMRGLVPASILDRSTRGAQAADWPDLLQRMRPEMTLELERLAENDTARRLLDIERMQALLDRWPDRFGPEHFADYGLRLLRGLMMGRFIRWFEARWP